MVFEADRVPLPRAFRMVVNHLTLWVVRAPDAWTSPPCSPGVLAYFRRISGVYMFLGGMCVSPPSPPMYSLAPLEGPRMYRCFFRKLNEKGPGGLFAHSGQPTVCATPYKVGCSFGQRKRKRCNQDFCVYTYASLWSVIELYGHDLSVYNDLHLNLYMKE